MKIIAIGWNYHAHNKEMNRAFIPTEPSVFLKPETALLKDGKPFFIPHFSKQLEYETELVVRINRLGKNIAPRFAHRYYDEVTVGIDFTARDLQHQQRQAGAPWEISKGFDGSAAVGTFVSKEKFANVQQLNFALDINGQCVQQGYTGDMIFSIDEIIAYVSQFFTLKIGDLIFTGTPSGVGAVQVDDRLTGTLEGETLLAFNVK